MTIVSNVGALYPGTFDPITNGHIDLIHRASKLFSRVVVAVADNPGKNPLFDLATRLQLAKTVLADVPNVTVESYTGLTLDFAEANNLNVMLRGIRAVSDFEFEFQLATMSRQLNPNIETVFLTPDQAHSFVSSTLVREVAKYHGDVSEFVPQPVLEALKQVFN